MSKNKSAYKEGADGKLYFTYNQGAEYKVLPPVSAPFTYKVLSCELDELTGKEYYKIESAGAELPARFSVNQIEFMLGRFPCEQTAEGEPVELPLLEEEVKAYYAAKRKELRKANVAANAKLDGTSYRKNLLVIKMITEKLRNYRANADETKVAELEANLNKIEETQRKILAEKGIDEKILRKQAECAECCDVGIKEGRICVCALDIADKIKAYNAELRRACGN